MHEDAESLLARDDLDAVVVCAPTPFHAELTVAACRAGKHVYVEKPIATTIEDGNRAVVAARRSGVTAVMGFNRRYHAGYRHARDLLMSERIGTIRAVQTAFCEPTPIERMPAWKRSRSTGGGVLLDLASHHVDLLRWFLDDEVESVRARAVSERSEQDGAWLALSMRGGVTAQGFFSYRAGLADYLEFIGEHGTLRVDRHRPGLSLRVPRRFGYGLRTRRWASRPASLGGLRLSYRRSLAAFVDLVRGGAERPASLDDGARALEAILAAEASVRLGEPVLAAQTPPG
jgi:myo-inositol 2-dehydrogenase/D-chiro-inositol 1-dehydrogenase